MKKNISQFVVIKRNKYLTGWKYVLGVRKYNWSSNVKYAKKFDALHSDADYFANITKGHLKQL